MFQPGVSVPGQPLHHTAAKLRLAIAVLKKLFYKLFEDIDIID